MKKYHKIIISLSFILLFRVFRSSEVGRYQLLGWRIIAFVKDEFMYIVRVANVLMVF